MDQDLNANPVSRLVCSNCSHEMDVAGREPFTQVICEQCGTQLTIPVMLGQFLLVERMGTGGMGAVYRALDTALNRFVAIKVMKSALGEDNKLVQSFITEAQAAAALNHPNIVQIYSCGTEKGQPYIVMELVTGGQMNHMFSRDEPMKELQLLKYAIGIAEGLKAANEVGLVHGDIKPENVLVDQNGTAKIVDFGLAQFVNAQKDRGEIWGTPYYISPERARGNKADHRSDIYSLGASMFHALTGQPPFDGKTAADVVLERLKHPPPDLRELRPDLQTETIELVNRMMAADPYLRYPNSASLKSDMKAALAAARESGKQSKQKHVKSSNKSSIVVALIAVAAVIGLGYGFFAMIKAEKEKPVVAKAITKPDTNTVAQTEKAEPEEELFSVEEIKGPDGKVRLKMTVKFFDPEEEARIIAAAETITSDGLTAASEKFEALQKELPNNSVRAMWMPVLNAVPLWAAGDQGRAAKGLKRVSSATIKKKDDHPAHMPRVIAGYVLGDLSDAELRTFRSEWPAWFGDLVHLVDGVKELKDGNTDEGWRKLNVYMERQRAEPEWVYSFRPAVKQWKQSFQDWEDMSRRVKRQLKEGITGPARQALEQYRKDVPPVLAGELQAVLKEVNEMETRNKEVAAVEAARLHRQAVQRDLDQIDEKMQSISALIMRNRDYRKASLSLSRLPSSMNTNEGRDAAKSTRELVDSLDQLKNYIIKCSDVLRYTRSDGSDLDGDVLSANALGVRVSLDGRAISTHGWDEISMWSLIKIADFYAGSTQFAERDRAEAYLSIGVFCLVNGRFEPAKKYAQRAAGLQPDMLPKIRRLMPGLLNEG